MPGSIPNSALTVSHPDIIAFAEAWRAETSDPPHARAVRAVQRRNEGYALRGPDDVDQIHPGALAAFAAKQDEAKELALEGLRLAGDLAHPPTCSSASEALTGEASDTLVASVMGATHDRDSLICAASVARPQ